MGKALPVIQYNAVDLIDTDLRPCVKCPMKEAIADKHWVNCRVVPAQYFRMDDGSPTAIEGLGVDEELSLLVVGDAPSEIDNKNGKFFSDKAGAAILQKVKELGLKTFALIASVRCFPGKDIDHSILLKKYKGGPTSKKRTTAREQAEDAVQHCKEYVKRIIAGRQPKMVLAMGPLAAKALGETTGIPNLHVDRIHSWKGLQGSLNMKEGVCFTWDRFQGKRDPQSRRWIFKDIRALKEIRETGYAHHWGREDTIETITLDTVAKVREFVDLALSDAVPEDAYLAFDYETKNTWLSTTHNKILNMGFSFTCDPDRSFVIPFAHRESPFSGSELGEVAALLIRLFRSIGARFKGWLAHYALFEVQMTKLFFGVWLGEDGDKPVLDTQIVGYLGDENRKTKGCGESPYSLETFALEMLGFRWYGDKKAKEKRDRLDNESIVYVNRYVGIDAAVTARLFLVLLEHAEEEGSKEDMLRLATHLYSEAMKVLSEISLAGQHISLDLLMRLRAPDSTIISRLREIEQHFATHPDVAKAMEIVNEAHSGSMALLKREVTNFSITSPEHKKALFWDVLQLDHAQESLDDKWQEMHRGHPLVDNYTEYQGLSKLDTSYLAPIATFMQTPSALDGRLHSSYSFCDTVSGRISSRKPNTQQYPQGKSAARRQIKSLIKAEKGNILYIWDASQAEIRTMACLAGDEVLAEKYQTAKEITEKLRDDPDNIELQKAKKIDGDLHVSTAISMHKLPADYPITNPKEMKLLRTSTKQISFGLLFRKTAKSLAKDLGVEEEKMAEDMEKWFAQFPKSTAWLNDIETEATEKGYVKSFFGRWRRLPDAKSEDTSVRNRSYRMARNSPIQSASSDGIVYGAGKLRKVIKNHPDPRVRGIKFINIVHDSVIAEGPADPEVIRIYCDLARQVMEDPDMLLEHWGFRLTVPVEIEMELGPNYGCVIPIDMSDRSIEQALWDCKALAEAEEGLDFSDLKGRGVLWKETH